MTTSVAICTYNGEKFLEEQLDSILSQTIPVDEIVVCDDASSDNTLDILKKYKDLHPEIIKVFLNKENLGYVRNFEKALSLCSGEVIFLCDQDDVWRNDKLEKVTLFFSQNSSVNLVAHNLSLLNASLEESTFWELKNFDEEKKNYPSDKLLEHLLIHGNVFPGMSLAVRRSFLQKNLPLKKIDAILIHDYELIIASLQKNSFSLINEVLSAYRQHDLQSIGYKKKDAIAHKNPFNSFYFLSQDLARIKKYSGILGLDKKIAENFQQEIKGKYSLFLKQFPFPQRIWMDLKNRYYYKIIHF